MTAVFLILVGPPPLWVVVAMFAADLLAVIYLVIPREERPTPRSIARTIAARLRRRR